MDALVRRIFAATAIACLWAGLIVPLPASAKKVSSSGLSAIGILEGTVGYQDGLVVGVNQETRRMYYAYQEGPNFYLAEYSLTSELPRLLRTETMGNFNQLLIGSFSPYTFAFDSKRDRMIILTFSSSRAGAAIKIIDLKTLKLVGTWDLASVYPGFIGHGLTYSKEDDRIYMVGSQVGSQVAAETRGFQKPAQPTAIAAFSADAPPDGTPKGLWLRLIPQCQHVLDTTSVGALIARSERLSALYIPCMRPAQWPGESGVVRLWIDKDADQSAALDFPVDFYPVSGSFTAPTNGTLGVAAFDPKTERFFMQSLARQTPGVWVFDGKVSAWIGFIVSPDDTNAYFGLDPSSGHYFMAGDVSTDGTGYVVVSDVSQTPVTQGLVVGGFAPRGFMSVDPSTHRVFMPVDLKAMGLYKGKERELIATMVIRDETKISDPERPIDYDELTSDVNEGPGVVTSFSGGVNGFGARVLLVGGYGGILSATGQNVPSLSFRPGDRGLTAARVPSVDLRSGGAAAKAQALVPDNNTGGDLHDTGQGGVEWPWEPASCLDGGGSGGTTEGAGPSGSAEATCNLEEDLAEASSTWGAITAEGFSVAGSSFHSTAHRDPKSGVITESVAVARGIEIEVPGAGTLSIAKIRAVAQTTAHGRSGSAEATYERKITGIELTDGAGKVVQRVGECGGKKDVTCHDAIERINKNLPMKIQVGLPRPLVVGTPKGAFAGVYLREGDFIEARTMNNHGSTFSNESASRAIPALQVTIYNDSEEKSRLVAQFASIEANSIYTNTRIVEQDIPEIDVPPVGPGIDPGAAGGSSGPVSLGSGSLDLGPLDGSATAAPVSQPVNTTVAAAPLEGSLAFLSRGPGSTVLFALVWTTFLASGAAAFRRKSLLALLLEGTGTK